MQDFFIFISAKTTLYISSHPDFMLAVFSKDCILIVMTKFHIFPLLKQIDRQHLGVWRAVATTILLTK